MISIKHLITLVATSVACGSFALAQPPKDGAPVPASVKINPAMEGSEIEAVTILVPGKPAWVTVVNGKRQRVSGVSVLVNGQPYDTNDFGRASFPVPNQGAVSMTLQNRSGEDVDRKDYALLPNGLLSSADAAPLVQRMIPSGSKSTKATLLYFPLVIEPGQLFAVVGSGFNADADGNAINIDGSNSEVVSGSAASLLARAPLHLSWGPTKDAYVTAKGNEPSAVMECDVAGAEFVVDRPPAIGSTEAKLQVQGTTLPGLVTVESLDSAFEIGLSDGKALSVGAPLLMPGGQDNFQPVTINCKSKARFLPKVHLVPDVPELLFQSESRSASGSSVTKAVSYAQLVKLYRKLFAVENRLLQERKRSVNAAGNNDEQEKRDAALNALAIRQSALTAAVATRRAIFQSFGGSDSQLKQAKDDATGGAYYVLESQLRDMQVVSNSPAGETTNTTVTQAQPQAPTPIALAVPVIRLLPPKPDDYDQKAAEMNALQLAPPDKSDQSAIKPVNKSQVLPIGEPAKSATKDVKKPTAKEVTKTPAAAAKKGASKRKGAKLNEPAAQTNSVKRRHRGRKHGRRRYTMFPSTLSLRLDLGDMV